MRFSLSSWKKATVARVWRTASTCRFICHTGQHIDGPFCGVSRSWHQGATLAVILVPVFTRCGVIRRFDFNQTPAYVLEEQVLPGTTVVIFCSLYFVLSTPFDGTLSHMCICLSKCNRKATDGPRQYTLADTLGALFFCFNFFSLIIFSPTFYCNFFL